MDTKKIALFTTLFVLIILMVGGVSADLLNPDIYWKFNEGSGNAVDSRGVQNLTIGTGGAYTTGGKLNNAATMTAATAPFQGSGISTYQFGTGVFTIAFWEQTNNTADIQIVKATSTAACADADGWNINNFLGTFIMCSNNVLWGDNGVDDSDGTWKRVVFVREGTGSNEFKKYVDNDNVFNDTAPTDLQDTSDFKFITTGADAIVNIDDFRIYKGYAWTVSDVNIDWNSGFGEELGGLTPFVTLISPSNDTSLINASTLFDSTQTISAPSGELTNSTLNIWFINGTIFNQTTININGTSNESIFNISISTSGSFKWNVLSCASNASTTLCGQAQTNQTFTFGFTVNNESFVTPAQEGSQNKFSINITYNTSITNTVAANLIYNNTIFSGIPNGTGSNVVFSRNIIAPSVTADTNISFFWQIVLDGVPFNLTTNKQTVQALTIDNCEVNTNLIINFTVFDEETQQFIPNATIETAVNIFNLDRTELILNVSSNQTNPVGICLNTNLTSTQGYLLDTVAKYTKEGQYAIEYFNFLNFSLSSSTPAQNVSLFALNLSDSTEFQLTFTGSDFLPVEGALVFVDRQYISENVFKTVELPLTDANGQSILHLVRNDVVYNIRIVKDGVLIGNFETLTAFCEDITIGNCKITLNAGDSTAAIFDYGSDLGILFNEPSFDADTNIVSFDFVTIDGSTKNVVMNVTRNDIFGNRTICGDLLISSGGTLSCNVGDIDDTRLNIIITVDGVQAVTSTVDLDTTGLGDAGYLVLFVMATSFVLLFSESKTRILFGVLLSFMAAIGLNLIQSDLIGVGATGLWLLVIIVVALWKLNKEREQ